jgi:hypothetical protein
VTAHHEAVRRQVRPPITSRLGGEALLTILLGLTLPALAAVVLWVDPWSLGERFDPMDRGHQVTAVSLLTLGTLLLSSVLLVAFARPSFTDARPSSWGLVTGGLAAVASGVWATGAVLALHGTSWSFFADQGDAGRYIEWAADLGARPAEYPPGGLWLLRGTALLLGTSEAVALKPVTILVMALTGPLAYLAWRVISGPTFALFAGVVVAIPFWHSYLPMRRIVLFLVVPVVVAGAQLLLARRPEVGWPGVVRAAGLGVGLGALVVVYSGWIYFIALALLPLAAIGLHRLWKDDRPGRRARLISLAAFVTPVVLLLSPYVLPIVFETDARPTALVDDFEPNIQAALASVPSQFLGETGLGVTLVVPVLLLAVVVLGSRRSILDLVIVGALTSAVVFRLLLLLRFGVTGNAGLFQRTTPVIGYLLLVAAVRGIAILAEAVRTVAPPRAMTIGVTLAFRRTALIAAALLLVINVPADVNAFMPAEEGPGRFAQVAHTSDPP